MLAHDRPLVHGRGALGSPHGHTPSFAANTGPREVTSSAAPSEHAPAGGREGEVHRPSYAARALVWVRWTRGAPWFGRCSRGAAQLEASRAEHLDYAQPRVLVGPPSRRGRGCILLVIPRACHLSRYMYGADTARVTIHKHTDSTNKWHKQNVPITITWHARGRGHVRLRVYARSAEGINDYIRTN